MGIEVKTAEDMVIYFGWQEGREVWVAVVLTREEERSNNALITDPLFGHAYLVPQYHVM